MIQMRGSNDFATPPFALPFALVFAFLASCISTSEGTFGPPNFWSPRSRHITAFSRLVALFLFDSAKGRGDYLGTHRCYCASFSHAFLDSPAMLSKCLTCHTFISSCFICWWAGASPRKWIQSMPGTAPNRLIMVYLDPFSTFRSTWSTFGTEVVPHLVYWDLLRSTESILVAHLDPARSACARWTRVLSRKLLIEPTWLQSKAAQPKPDWASHGGLTVQRSTSIPYGSFF